MRIFSKAAQTGFTLLEVIIAMAIMTIALSAILSVESGSINASVRTKNMNVVAMLARNKMIAVEQDFEGKTFEEYKKEDKGTFEAPYQDYGWEVKVAEVEFPTFSGGGGSEGGGGEASTNESADMVAKLVAKYLSKAIREVQVSILWGPAVEKRQSFTISTYWVDLNHEFETTQ